MYVFGYDNRMAGTFTAVDLNTEKGHGAFLELVQGANLPQGFLDSMIVTGISFSEREKFHIVDCFNDVAHTYAFGHDPTSSMVSISYVGFLVSPCTKGAGGEATFDSLTRMLEAYSSNRISKNPVALNVHLGATLLKGFLISIQSGTSSVDYNLQNYSMELLAVDVIEPNYG